MITVTVDAGGAPVIPIPIAGQQWRAVVDTAFTGDLELPETLRASLDAKFIGRTRFLLAAGQTAVQDTFLVNFPFDGETLLAEATFADTTEILIGTGLLRQYRLEVHFPNRVVALERVA